MAHYRVFQRKGFNCTYCGAPANTVDHVIPKSKGGTNSIDNLVPACSKCNQLKGDRDLQDFLKNRNVPVVEVVTPKPAMKPLARDYYKMELPELEKSINEMRAWLWKYRKHEQTDRVLFALEVACRAKDIYNDRKADPWLQEVVDIFTELPKNT